MTDDQVRSLAMYGYSEAWLADVAAKGIDLAQLLDLLTEHGPGYAALTKAVLNDWMAGRLDSVGTLTTCLLGYGRMYGWFSLMVVEKVLEIIGGKV